MVSDIVSRFHDIVNPNKQTWSFTDAGIEAEQQNESIVWVDVLVTDRVDSVSENWTAILRRSGYEPGCVRWSVLWRFGFSSDISEHIARKKALELTVSTRRDHGLLANPVSLIPDLPHLKNSQRLFRLMPSSQFSFSNEIGSHCPRINAEPFCLLGQLNRTCLVFPSLEMVLVQDFLLLIAHT